MPDTYDIAWSVVAVAALVLTGVALVRWFREHRAGWHGLLDLAVIVLVPVLGALAYVVSRHRTPLVERSERPIPRPTGMLGPPR